MPATIDRHARPWDGPLCGLIWLLAALLTHPFVESGLIDDFSYVKSALAFADTHHIAYNGWAAPTLIWQLVWGGLFAHLFGHTFTAVRLANLVTGFATVWIAQAIFSRAGLNRRNAIAGALVFALSPLFLPMSITFMSDISGLFSILVAFYCCLRAIESESDGGSLGWIVAAGLLSILGSTVRQIAWMSPLVMLPSAAWILRRRRGIVPVTIVLWLLAAVSLFALLRWFSHQPFSVPEPLIQGAFGKNSFRQLLGSGTAAILSLTLLLTPLLAAATAKRLRARQIVFVLCGTVLLTVFFRFLTFHTIEKGWAPWDGDILDKIGMLRYHDRWTFGAYPAPFAAWGRMLVSFGVVAIALWFAVVLRQERTAAKDQGQPLAWRPLLILTVPFLLAYCALLCPRGLWDFIIDRYLLPPFVFAILFVLRLCQQHIGPRLPSITYVLLGLFGIFTIAGTHDWVAAHRARVQAVARLQSQGVDRTAIQAGYELDAIVQIDRAGAVIDSHSHIKYPPNIETAPWRPADLPYGCREIPGDHTPVIRPRYFFSFDTKEPSLTPGDPPCLVESNQQPQVYTAWLPPFRRRIYILQRP